MQNAVISTEATLERLSHSGKVEILDLDGLSAGDQRKRLIYTPAEVPSNIVRLLSMFNERSDTLDAHVIRRSITNLLQTFPLIDCVDVGNLNEANNNNGNPAFFKLPVPAMRVPYHQHNGREFFIFHQPPLEEGEHFRPGSSQWLEKSIYIAKMNKYLEQEYGINTNADPLWGSISCVEDVDIFQYMFGHGIEIENNIDFYNEFHRKYGEIYNFEKFWNNHKGSMTIFDNMGFLHGGRTLDPIDVNVQQQQLLYLQSTELVDIFHRIMPSQ